MRNLLVVIMIALSSVAGAQISVNAGGSMLLGFGNKPTNWNRSPWGGFHVGFEVPRDDAVSIYLRYTHHFKQTAKDTSLYAFAYHNSLTPPPTEPAIIANKITPSMNYHIIEGGTRYYLGNGFDYGFAAYGGTSIMLLFNTVKVDYPTIDETKYTYDQTSRMDGSILSVGFGLGGGVKYSIPRIGTIYFDANVDYMIFAQASKNGIYGDLYAPLIFNFNLGYRKDIIW